jgi:hypothetical protein
LRDGATLAVSYGDDEAAFEYRGKFPEKLDLAGH